MNHYVQGDRVRLRPFTRHLREHGYPSETGPAPVGATVRATLGESRLVAVTARGYRRIIVEGEALMPAAGKRW